jgi:hypothetical protein
MRPPLTVVVNLLAESELGPALAVQLGQFSEEQVVDDGRDDRVGIRRATWYVDGFDSQSVTDALGSRRIRIHCLYSAISRASPDRYYRGGVLGRFGRIVDRCLAGYHERFRDAGSNSAFDDGYVATLLDGLGEILLSPFAGGSHDRLLVVQADDAQDYLGGRGIDGFCE